MDTQLVKNLIGQIEGQLSQLQTQKFLCEMQVIDAQVKTGNDVADTELARQGEIAANTIAMLDRQIEVRAAKLAELTALVPASVSTASAQVVAATGGETVPPIA